MGGGRHKAPAATTQRAGLGARVRATLRRPGRHTPPATVPPVRVWVIVEATAVALIVGVVGALLVVADIVVDWREPLLGAALLFAPLAIRHVVLGMRHRWPALVIGYVVLFGLGYLALRGAETLWSSTTSGFVGAAVGVLLCGTAFFLVSNVRHARTQAASRATADRSAPEAPEVPASVDPASAPTGPLPAVPADTDPPTDPFTRPADEADSDTDAFPTVRADEERRAQ